jgi:ribosomal protein S12 methylthiotransferase accessory factor
MPRPVAAIDQPPPEVGLAAAVRDVLDVQLEVLDGKGLPATRWVVRARTAGPVVVEGFGAAPDRTVADALAVLECAERFSLLREESGSSAQGTWTELRGEAVDPRELGLYRPEQYDRFDGGIRPFDENEILEWIPLRDRAAGRDRLVPVEFVHPAARLHRPPLVAETSSGTAARASATDALDAALCEVVERDALMLAWHRRAPIRVMPPSQAVRPGLDALNEAGWLTALLRIDQDLPLPCVLAVALQGTRFRHGLGCHPDAIEAARHALREVSAGVGLSGRAESFVHLPLSQVRTPADHLALYDGGPLHPHIRAFLESALPALPSAPTSVVTQRPADVLATAGYDILWRDIAPPALRDAGLSVVRALVPGLVPLSFGHHRLRLGVQRLNGPAGPPVFLPHFHG